MNLGLVQLLGLLIKCVVRKSTKSTGMRSEGRGARNEKTPTAIGSPSLEKRVDNEERGGEN